MKNEMKANNYVSRKNTKQANSNSKNERLLGNGVFEMSMKVEVMRKKWHHDNDRRPRAYPEGGYRGL